MKRSGWIRRALCLLPLLGAAPGWASSGAQGAGQCWDRGRIAAAARAAAPMHGLVTGAYRGYEEVHDPENRWTKSRRTGRNCEIRVSRDAAGQFTAESNFLPAPVVLDIPMSNVDFYMGQAEDGRAFILQQHPRGISATYTNFNSQGVLNYGHCAEDGYFIWNCTASPAP